MRKEYLLSIFLGVGFSIIGGLLFGATSYAADARNYNAGRIIDDAVFTNIDSMSVQDIQRFLESKVSCDTWGSKRSELGGGTRAQWMNSRGIYAPFRCIVDYRENVTTGANNYSKNEAPAGSLSAAEIIYNYSRQFGINPQVIIVTLQKENGLITDEWPTPKQFSESMGFGCPDNIAPGAPACDPQYGSFSAQVFQAARHFRGYIDNKPGWWIPFSTGWNSIAWSPTASCGRGDVYIENRSTVALYSYTPYQPNQAAKNAQYGGGDGCSAYGNRNFYLYFNDWFGSTFADVAITSPLRISGAGGSVVNTNSPVKVSFSIHNYRGSPMYIGGMSVAVRDSQGRNFDYPLKDMTIPAYTTINYEQSQIFPTEGAYTFEIVNYSNGAWKNDYPSTKFAGHDRKKTVMLQHAPTVVDGIQTPTSIYKGGASQVSFTVKNNSATSMNLGKIGLAVRGPAGQNYDQGVQDITLAGGATRQMQYNFVAPEEGAYTFFVAATIDNGMTWETGYPRPLSSNQNIQKSVVVKPSIVVTDTLKLAQPSSYVGSNSNVILKVANKSLQSVAIGKLGLWGRDPQNRNVDPGVIDVTLAPGEERTMNFPVGFNQKGKYQFGILSTTDNGRTWQSGPAIDDTSYSKEMSTEAIDPVKITSALKLTNNTFRVGTPNALTYTIKNSSTATVMVGKLGLWGRDPQNRNVDPGVIDVTLAPGEERTMNFPINISTKGKYKFGILSTSDNGRTWQSGPELQVPVVSKEAEFVALDRVTITEGINSLDIVQPAQVRNLTFKVKNHSTTSINIGKLGLWGRDPQNRNVDPGVIEVTLAAGEERIMSFPVLFSQKGKYKFGILSTTDNGRTWQSGPDTEVSGLILEREVTVN